MASHLFQPIRLAGLQLENRIVVSPMCQYSAENGFPTTWHLIHLGHLALSGAGLMLTEATAVEPEGRISPADLGIWSDEHEAAIATLARAIRHESAMPIGMQLCHAGRKASVQAPWEGGEYISPEKGGWRCLAPSAIPQKPSEPPPIPLDEAGLARVRDGFVRGAERASRAGMAALELHAAHGYLLHQFLSPLSNLREDEYGGSLENRMRFPLEVFDGVRAVFPSDRPVGVRVSATDWVDSGWEINQTVAFAKELQQRGCDWIDVSSGGLMREQNIPLGPGYQVGFAELVKRATGLPTMAVGLITEPLQAEAIIADGKADMVALARGLLYDPRWPWHAAAELGAEVDAPKQYWRSQPREHKRLFGATSIEQR